MTLQTATWSSHVTTDNRLIINVTQSTLSGVKSTTLACLIPRDKKKKDDKRILEICYVDMWLKRCQGHPKIRLGFVALPL